jgi:hypothetical protein
VTDWDAQEISTLVTEWRKGTSVTEIGKLIGRTRNAVAGKRNRLGLPNRESPIIRYDNTGPDPSKRHGLWGSQP